MPDRPILDRFLQQLRNIPIFEGLDEATLQELAQGAVRREYQANEMVV